MKSVTLVLSLVIFLICAPGYGAAAVGQKQVLVLLSYDVQDQWSATVLEGISSAFAEKDVHIHVEQLDSRRHHGESYIRDFESFIKAKYAKTRLDLAIVADNAAFDLMLRIRPAFRPGLPVVFCGVNNFKPDMIAGQDNITGVNEAVDIPGAVNLALKLFPDVSQLSVVSATSGVGAVNLDIFRKSVPAFSRKIDIQELLDVPRASLTKVMTSVPKNSILLRLDNLREPDGSNTPLQESISLLSTEAPCPVFSLWDFDMGHGAFGGIAVSGLAQGRKAGELALLALQGRPIESIPVVMQSPNVPMFDYVQVQRFKVDVADLPSDAVIINMPMSFYDRYKGLLWTGVTVVTLMSVCIIALIFALLARRKAENALRVSEERYRLLVDTAAEGVWQMDTEHHTTYVNQAMSDMLGYSLKHMLGRKVEEFFFPEDMPLHEAHMAKRHVGVDETYERRFRRADGSQLWTLCSAKAQRNAEGLFAGSFAMFTDITNRKRIEADLRRSELRLRTLIDSIPDLVWLKDTEGFYLFCNPAFERFFGHKEEQILGKSDYDFFDPALAEFFRDNDRKAIEAGGSRMNEEWLTFAQDGYQGLFETLKTPMRDETGATIGVLGIARDITERKMQAEELESFFSVNLDLLCIADMDGNFIKTNEAWSRTLGYSTDDLHKMKYLEIVHPDDKQPTIDAISKLRKGEDLDGLINRCHSCDESYRYIEWRSRPVEGKIYSAARDITERVQLETELRQSENRLRLANKATNDVIWDWDVIHDTQQWNEAGTTVFGWTEIVEHPVGALWWVDRVHPDDRQRVHDSFFSIVDNPECDVWHDEYRFLKKDGSYADVLDRGYVLRDIHGNAVRMIGAMLDITHRKRAEEALAASENNLRALLNAISESAALMDRDGIVLAVNRTFADRLGRKVSDCLGQAIFSFIPPEIAHKRRAMFEEVLRSGDSIAFEDYRLGRWMSHHLYPVASASGSVERIAIFAMDLTERKRAEQALLKAKEQAEIANKSKSEFLANMSHELRTPMNGVMGMLQLMDASNQEPEQSEMINMALQSCRRLTRLLSDILDLSRIEAGKLNILHERFCLRDTFQAVEQLFRPVADQVGIALRFQFDPAVPDTILGDPIRMQQLLNNLVGNALKFTPQGEVAVEVGCINAQRPGKRLLLFSISDTGVGIPDDQLEALFEPFTQAEGSYTRKYQGAGLGLSIVKRLVELMNGTLSVESEVGVGSIFHVCIPFDVDHRPATTELPSSDVAFSPLKEQNLLLAEDDEMSAMVVVRQLERIGWSVHVAADGQQALNLLKDHAFDLILMDVQMPVLDGVEATRRIRAGEAGDDMAEIPIIALTAYAMAGDREKFLEAGMDGYLAKPFEMHELFKAIDEAMSKTKIRSSH